jgi:hypothetical protein
MQDLTVAVAVIAFTFLTADAPHTAVRAEAARG